MQKSRWNPYQTARKCAGLSQESAAEVLNLSTESIRAYETERTIPPNETVAQMAAAYETPWLKVVHLSRSAETLGVIPSFRLQGLSTATLQLMNKLQAFADDIEALKLIAEDGEVDDTEQDAFDEIKNALNELIAAEIQVIFAVDTKKERPEAGTSKRSSPQMRTNCNSYYNRNSAFCNTFLPGVAK